MSRSAMTSVAKFILGEAQAAALVHALDGEELLAALPASLAQAPRRQWQVIIYLSANRERAELAALRRLTLALFGKSAPQCSVERLPDTDWVTKSLEGLGPVRAGRFLVHGSHDRGVRHPNDIAIEIDAGQAFGTGHHGTTVGCLVAIDRVTRSRPIARALDVGTGTGILAIAIAKAAKACVLASDIDPVAIRLTRDNARLNGVAGLVATTLASNLHKRDFPARGPYDLVVANILAGPLIAMAPALSRHVAPGGSIILSGLVPDQRARVVAAYRAQGLLLQRVSVLDDWLTIVFGRPTRRMRDRTTTDLGRRCLPEATSDRFRRRQESPRRASANSHRRSAAPATRAPPSVAPPRV